MRIRVAAVAAALAVLATAGCSAPATGLPRPAPRPTARSIELAAVVRWWWKRAASMPKKQYFDPRLCGLKQPYRIWLLAGGAPKGQRHRTCQIPAHRPILAPVVNELLPGRPNASHPPPVEGRMSVVLDGRKLTPIDVRNDRPYPIAAIAGNPIGLSAGDQTATDRGYWVLITAGLAPGRHRLSIHTPEPPSSRSWLIDSW